MYNYFTYVKILSFLLNVFTGFTTHTIGCYHKLTI